MSDIVERLRNHVNHRGGPTIENSAWQMMLEAAAEIEKLKIQCDEEYLSGMKHGWNCCVSNNEARYQQSVNIAREQIVAARAAAAALKETDE